MEMEQAKGISQFFTKRRKDGSISILLAKITDDLLIAGELQAIKDFIEKLTGRFKVSKSIIDSAINFNVCRIQQDEEGNFEMNMADYLNMIKPLHISRMRRKESDQNATQEEYDAYRSLLGSLMWAGNGTFLQASFVASQMQQTEPRLSIRDITEANKMLKELKDMNPTLTFNNVDTDLEKMGSLDVFRRVIQHHIRKRLWRDWHNDWTTRTWGFGRNGIPRHRLDKYEAETSQSLLIQSGNSCLRGFIRSRLLLQVIYDINHQAGHKKYLARRFSRAF